MSLNIIIRGNNKPNKNMHPAFPKEEPRRIQHQGLGAMMSALKQAHPETRRANHSSAVVMEYRPN